MRITPAVARAIEDIERPMRWPEAESIARAFSSNVIQTWYELFDDLNAWLSDRGAEVVRPNRFKTAEKTNEPSDIETLLMRQRLGQYLTQDELAELDELFTRTAAKYAPANIPDGSTIFEKFLGLALLDAWRKAYEHLYRNASMTGRLDTLNLRSPENAPMRLGITGQAFLSRGYELVRSKVSFGARGIVYSGLLNGLQNGATWTEIAESILEKTGGNYLYHWKRLIRTEMVRAHYIGFTERYREAGVQYLRWSASPGACPVCTSRLGIYRMGSQPLIPDVTHPNCRCLYLPLYSLPDGEVVRA